MKKLFEFLDNLETAEEMTSDTDDTYRVGMWVAHKNETKAKYEGGNFQDPRIAIMYDGTQGQNGWYWEVIEGKDVVGTSDTVFKTADDAREDAEMWIDELYEEAPEEPDLGRLGENFVKPGRARPGIKSRLEAMRKEKRAAEKKALAAQRMKK